MGGSPTASESAEDGTNVVVTLPALGAGSANASVTAWGYLR